MIELSHRNHFKFGYDRNWFQFRTSKGQKWTVQYGQIERQTKNFFQECVETAKVISQNADNLPTILFSGGSDSEVVIRSFIAAKVPFKVAVLKFKHDLNEHDIFFALKSCDSLGIAPTIVELDVLKFWEERIFDYADQTYCVSPQLLTTMWLVDQLDGYPILGSGECLLVKDKELDYTPGVSPYVFSEWSLWEKEKIAAWYRHFHLRNRAGCPGFFQYTPEILLSYLQDPLVQKLIKCEIPGKLTTESSKLKIYQQHFQLEDREKYTGFEKIQDFDYKYRQVLKAKFPYHDEIFKTYVNELIESLTGKNSDSNLSQSTKEIYDSI